MRSLLQDLPPDIYELVIGWDGSAEDLIEMIPFLKQGFDHEDFFTYQAAKGLLIKDAYAPGLGNYSEGDLKRHLLDKLDHEYKAVREWISSGRGVRFTAALTQAQATSSGLRKYVRGHGKRRRTAQRSAKG